jgi:phosphohistidine phosphatase
LWLPTANPRYAARYKPDAEPLDRISGICLGCLPSVGRSYLDWVLLVFPAWVLLVSVYILIDNLRGPHHPSVSRWRMSKRQLLLLRHAKSSRDDPSIADHERPLSKRGRKAEETMRRMMRSDGLVPDLVLVSPGRRTMETLAALHSWDKPPLIDGKEELYLATAPGMLQILRNVGDRVRSVLLIGHNPGLHDLAVLLVGARTKAGTGKRALSLAMAYPTCGLAEFALTVRGPRSAKAQES